MLIDVMRPKVADVDVCVRPVATRKIRISPAEVDTLIGKVM